MLHGSKFGVIKLNWDSEGNQKIKKTTSVWRENPRDGFGKDPAIGRFLSKSRPEPVSLCCIHFPSDSFESSRHRLRKVRRTKKKSSCVHVPLNFEAEMFLSCGQPCWTVTAGPVHVSSTILISPTWGGVCARHTGKLECTINLTPHERGATSTVVSRRQKNSHWSS